MPVDIVGIENLKTHLATFQHISKLELCDREKSTRAILITSREAPVDELVRFFEDQQQHESAKYAQRYIKVFLKGPNTTSENGKDYVGFVFAIDERGRTAPINGPPASPVFNESMMHVYEERGFLRSENARLVNRIADLEDELQEYYDDEKDEVKTDKVNGTEQIMGYMDILAKLKDIFPSINGLPGQQNISQDMELNNTIAELQLSDPYFKIRMTEYLNAIKNPNAAGNNNNETNPNAGNNGNGNGVG